MPTTDERALRLTLTAIWIAVAGGAWFILRQEWVAFAAAFGAATALWIESSCYAASGFVSARNWFGRLSGKSTWLALSVLPSYLAYSLGTGTFEWRYLLALLLGSFTAAYWFNLLPQSDWTDIGFLALIASGLLLKPFPFLFPPLTEKLKQSEFIGHIMLLRVAFFALLGIRAGSTAGFGFLPRRVDWAIGAKVFLYSLPVFAILLPLTQSAAFKDRLSWSQTPFILIGTFIGIYLVVALSEDFLVQGIFLPIMTRWTGSFWSGLAVTSACFGLVHLSYHRFPNWRMVLLAGVLGAFCGRAVQLSGSIRASMVTHALAVTVYRTFFSDR